MSYLKEIERQDKRDFLEIMKLCWQTDLDYTSMHTSRVDPQGTRIRAH